MANTDLNQLFNTLLPMLLQAGQRRRSDDLAEKERQFQRQNTLQQQAESRRRFDIEQENIDEKAITDRADFRTTSQIDVMNAMRGNFGAQADIADTMGNAALATSLRERQVKQDANIEEQQNLSLESQRLSNLQAKSNFLSGERESLQAQIQALSIDPEGNATQITELRRRRDLVSEQIISSGQEQFPGLTFDAPPIGDDIRISNIVDKSDSDLSNEQMFLVVEEMIKTNPGATDDDILRLLKKTQKQRPALPVGQFGGEFQVGARAATKTKDVVSQFIQGLSGFDVESFRE